MLPKLYMYVKKEVLCCKFLILNNCNFVCFRVFLHSRDRIVAASRPLQIYTESANPIGAVLAYFFLICLAT
jgi:hypothetical protein